jgi:hypothetical protein
MRPRNRETSYYVVRKYVRENNGIAKELKLIGYCQGEGLASSTAERLERRLTKEEKDSGVFYEQAWAPRDEARAWIAAHRTPAAPKKYYGPLNLDSCR